MAGVSREEISAEIKAVENKAVSEGRALSKTGKDALRALGEAKLAVVENSKMPIPGTPVLLWKGGTDKQFHQYNGEPLVEELALILANANDASK